ncbi:MAG TPA: alpha/beta hydrolase-fold protein [Polyangia bacterium]|nr:alpha/beta hydrolase-fold protein [Polyangia bacterium]
MANPKHGRVEILRHASRVLAENPLGDPAERDVAVYLPPSYDGARRFPMVMFLPGYTGSGVQLLNRAAWTPSLAERWDAAIAEGRAAEAIVVMPDCFSRYGGSQYLDSPAIGRYQTYLTDEVLPLVDEKLRTIPRRDARAVAGKSSGGFGALTLGLERADVFCALASHAGDSAFELSYLRDFGQTLLTLEKKGGVRGFLDWFERLPSKPNSAVEVMAILCNAAAYSPSASGPYGWGVGFELPFHPLTGVLVEGVWSRWLARDPVRLLDQPRVVEAARSLACIYLDAGIADEFYLQLGARQLASKLARHGIAHVHEEFDGGHMNVPYRYARSYEVVTRALAAE